jgi:hypothetical protein
VCHTWAIYNRRGGIVASYQREEAAVIAATLLNTEGVRGVLPRTLEASQEAPDASGGVSEAPAPVPVLTQAQIEDLATTISEHLHGTFDGCDCDGVLPQSARGVVYEALCAWRGRQERDR